ncbi:MAG: class I SAM-dependent methyltransferase [Caldisericaceae bacterium]|nr:class I SAM-dependent methyltransferase [Caldisericaceae bacterium]
MSTETKKANFFFPIIDTWPEYFENPHEGLGTTYERFLLHGFFQRLDQQFNIEQVLEAPSFGMTGISGINSLWWAKKQKQVTVVDDHLERLTKIQKIWQQLQLQASFCLTERFEKLPFADQSFDLSWNFASLWFVKDLPAFCVELSRLTRQVIFICVPNRYGVGYQIRLRWPGGTKPELQYQNIGTSNIRKELERLNWRLAEKGYFDVPPWPDFPLKKEVLFDKLKVGFLLKLFSKQKKLSATGERMTILDYFSNQRPDLEQEVFKFKFLEKAPFPIRQLWAHHQYLIFVKD